MTQSEHCKNAGLQSLADYIAENYGSNVDFATAVGVSKQQVSNWIAAGFVVCDDVLYSKRRELPKT